MWHRSLILPPLAGLKEHLGAAGFTRLPPALTAATHLHSLGFSDTASSMRITRDDVNSILAHMGQLRQLRCTNVETWGALMKPPVLLHLFSSMPQLIVPEDWD